MSLDCMSMDQLPLDQSDRSLDASVESIGLAINDLQMAWVPSAYICPESGEAGS